MGIHLSENIPQYKTRDMTIFMIAIERHSAFLFYT